MTRTNDIQIHIKDDVIACFNKATRDEFNTRSGFGTTEFWNFVESDMYMGLRETYASEYIDACFNCLADYADNQFDLDRFDYDGQAIYKMGLVKEGVAA